MDNKFLLYAHKIFNQSYSFKTFFSKNKPSLLFDVYLLFLQLYKTITYVLISEVYPLYVIKICFICQGDNFFNNLKVICFIIFAENVKGEKKKYKTVFNFTVGNYRAYILS